MNILGLLFGFFFSYVAVTGVYVSSVRAETHLDLSDWRKHASTLRITDSVSAQSLSAPGEISFDEERTQYIAAPLSGRIAHVHVRVGDTVAANQPLFDIVSPQVGELAALLHKAEEDVALARQENGRSLSLLKAGAVSNREAGQAASVLRKAEADLAQHRAHMSALGLRLASSGLLASAYARRPGVVVERNVVTGQEVRAESADRLLVVSDLSHLWVVANVYEEQISGILPGASVDVSVSALTHETFFATVTQISDVVDPMTRAIRVRADLANPTRRLKPHMFARMTIARPHAQGLRIPSDAVVMSGGQTFVVVVAAQDSLEVREVTLGPLFAAGYQVSTGLKVGEEIVVHGALFLHDALTR